MAPWLRVLEAYLVQALLRSPTFHRGVEKVVKNVHRARYGIPPEEMGGTKIDQPGESSFFKHFSDEVQTQIGWAEAKNDQIAAKGESRAGAQNAAPRVGDEKADDVWRNTRQNVRAEQVEDESADAAWRSAQKKVEDGHKQQGFMGEYLAALREQVRGGK